MLFSNPGLFWLLFLFYLILLEYDLHGLARRDMQERELLTALPCCMDLITLLDALESMSGKGGGVRHLARDCLAHEKAYRSVGGRKSRPGVLAVCNHCKQYKQYPPGLIGRFNLLSLSIIFAVVVSCSAQCSGSPGVSCLRVRVEPVGIIFILFVVHMPFKRFHHLVDITKTSLPFRIFNFAVTTINAFFFFYFFWNC